MLLEPFIRRLSRLATFSHDDESAISRLPHRLWKDPKHRTIIERGFTPSFLYVVLEGWAGRYAIRPGGSRRISNLLLPGDFCCINALCRAPLDHSVAALSDCTVALIEVSDLEPLMATIPALNLALWREKLIDEAILRMNLLNSSDAYRSLAHFICELNHRLPHEESKFGRRITMPLTQEDVGDLLSLTAVHTNRMFRQLREDKLVRTERGVIDIPDVKELQRVARFDSSYLQSGT
jgi:CRP-like cAMP-binding protein